MARPVTTTCQSCGATVEVRPSGYLASHNMPPSEDGYVARCGNRRVATSTSRSTRTWKP